MAIATLLQKVKRLQALVALRQQAPSILEVLRDDPTQVLTRANMPPDDWQREALRSKAKRMLLLASRQAGKSSVAAALALHTALIYPRSPVLLMSPSIRPRSSESGRRPRVP